MKRYALVVGISHYDGMGNLSKPAGDAIAVQQVLVEAGWQVTCLSDRVSYETLEKELKTFLERQASGQDALIYFTGHGFMVEESRYEQRGYLATSDCAVDYEGATIVAQRKALSFSYLNGLIQEARLSSLVVLLDCCHGGLFVEDGLVKRSFQANPDQNFCWIAACRSFQRAYAWTSEQHSLFTGALLAALARSGEVTVLSVLQDVTAAFKRSEIQEPIYIGAGTDIPLISPKAVTIAPSTISEENPYQGLQAFTKETKRFFFGRDRVVDDLVLKLQESNFVPLIGPSGSGKSSVVRAGLIPRLEDLGWHVLEPMKPGVEPIYELKRTLDPIFDRRQLASIHQRLDDKGLRGISDLLPDRKHLLVVDQFEEVFTLSGDRAKQRRFIEMLVGLEVGDRLSVVTTMRSDFVESWQAHGDLVGVLQGRTVWMPPLEGNDLRDAIVRPAEVQGYRFETELEALILEDVATEVNCLPLLEFALERLWEQREQQNRQLTVEVYRGMGRLMGALDRYATDWYERLTIEQQEAVRRVMLALVRVGIEMKDTRRRRTRSEVAALRNGVEEVMDLLVENRLVVSEGEEIDLVHERLMEGWELFSRWRTKDRELRRLAQLIEDEYAEWENQDQDECFLLNSGRLKRIQHEWTHIYPSMLSESIAIFYQRSLEAEADRTSFEGMIDSFKQGLLSIQNNLSQKTKLLENFISDHVDKELGTGISSESIRLIQHEINNFMQRTQAFEERMKAANTLTRWIESHYEIIINFLIKEVFVYLSSSSSSVRVDRKLVEKDIIRLLNWLSKSIMGGQPFLEGLPLISTNLPTAAYGTAFLALEQLPEINLLNEQPRQEALLYLSYLSDVLEYID
jgi:energy-coupling factor transporter ATP-binding protein EcfA2